MDQMDERSDAAFSQLTERELRLLITIFQEIAGAKDYLSSVEIALRRICESTGWVMGEIWMPNAENSALERRQAWHVPSQELDEFDELSKKSCFPLTLAWPGSFGRQGHRSG
jgi:hypothetical protein